MTDDLDVSTPPAPVDSRINLPGGWYFEQCNPPHGVIYALRTPKGQGFGIKGTGMSMGLSAVRAFAATLSGQTGGAVPAGNTAGRLSKAFLDGCQWFYKNSHDRHYSTQKKAAEAYGLKNGAVPAGELPPRTVEDLAQHIHDEVHGHPWTWPEHDDDTGKREGGYVRLTPSDVRSECREQALHIWRFLRLAEQPGGGPVAPGGDLRPGLKRAIKIVEDERETVSSLSLSYLRCGYILDNLRAALDGASSSGEG